MAAKDPHYKVYMGWIESLVITVIFILISRLIGDQLSLSSTFPWIWFAPILIALRYGIWPSTFSIALLLADYLYVNFQQLYVIDFQVFVLGGFSLTFLCSSAQMIWKKKIIYSEEVSDYLQQRIQSIAYGYKVVKLAYSRLEHNFISKPVTLRSSLDELKKMLSKMNEESKASIFDRLLNILALQCGLEVAGVFPVEKNKIVSLPIASIGMMKTPANNDYLVTAALETNDIAYVRSDEMLKGNLSDFLIVAPFSDQDDKIYALLIVQEMPFLSLNNENLGTVNLIIQYFEEGSPVKGAELILEQYHDCPIDFANEFQRLFNLQKITKQDSAAVSFLFPPSLHRDDYLFKLKQEVRGIDSYWETERDDIKILLVVMPFIGRAGVEIYKARISEVLEKQFNINLNEKYINFKSSQLSSANNPLILLKDLTAIT